MSVRRRAYNSVSTDDKQILHKHGMIIIVLYGEGFNFWYICPMQHFYCIKCCVDKKNSQIGEKGVLGLTDDFPALDFPGEGSLM